MASELTRRTVMAGATMIGAAWSLSDTAEASTVTDTPTGTKTVSTPADLVVATGAGRVRGFLSDEIATFKGIPYGDARERFMPPRPPQPWQGIRTCYAYGPICPQSTPKGTASDSSRFYSSGEPAPVDEDCLRANVWTPGIGTSARRPVLVWIHGGGFNSGSSHESDMYHGEAISRRGDLVVVSFNHRLNALGFLNLAACGPGYARSANAGLLDLVQGLQWVRDTIAAFGGDPGNVTIMGQSGGGRKISTLLAMPAAKGLFHKAIIHSGSLLTVSTPDQTARLAARTMEILGIVPGDVEHLSSLPPATLIAAYDKVCAALTTPESTVFDYPYTAPTLDGVDLPVQPFGEAAPAISAQVPLLVGTCLHEQSTGRAAPERIAMGESEMRAALARDYGADTDTVIDIFRRAHPVAPPFEILSLVEAVTPRRVATVRQARLKAALHAAPVYNFQFAWRTPMLDSAPLAHHGADLPFALFNIDRALHATGGGPDARRLAERMSDAWIAFARTGNPNTRGLPHWPPVTLETLPTMVFDTICDVRFNHDSEERRVATMVPASLRHL